MSLRRRVLLGLGLIGLLLVVADLAVAGIIRSTQLDEVDRRVVGQAERAGTAATFPRRDATRAEGTSVADRIPGGSQLFVELRGPDGQREDQVFPVAAVGAVTPQLDATVVVARAAAPGTVPAAFTAAASDGTDWRVAVIALPEGRGYLVRGQSLADLEATFARIVGVEVAATLVVLAGLALVGWWVVRLGVRPVNQMSDDALAIAAGDRDRRIEPAPAGTEVGKLATSLNTMIHELDQARVEQQEANAQLRRFVADASHELRTPLTSVLGYSEMLGRDDLDDADREDLRRRLDAEAHHMSVLVEELLLLARLDEGRPLERVPVDLVALVATVVDDLRAAQPDRDVSGRWPDEQVLVEGDPTRLRQVVVNLVDNACTHTPAGTPIDVSVAAPTTPGGPVLSVADRGPGLPAGTHHKVFERFYRADPARSGPGNGLGLAIVAAICRAHGAVVDAADRDGGGAVFTVRFPADRTREVPAADATGTSDDAAGGAPGSVSTDQARPTTLAAT
ncbi:MAG: HAMP domain-containing sensor histidine kinase [Acidimicrobiales bacterium]